MSTPSRHRRTTSTNTPGDASVRSTRSNRSTKSVRSVRSNTSNTSSKKPGVPWNIQKQLAQDIEDRYPLAKGGVNALLSSRTQALDKLLTERNLALGKPFYGVRGDPLRGQIGDLVQHWKKKSYQDYQKILAEDFQIQQRIHPREEDEELQELEIEEEGSSLSSSSQFEDAEEKPTPRKTASKTQSKTPSKTASKTASKTPIRTPRTSTLKGAPDSLPRTITTSPTADLQESLSKLSLGTSSTLKMSRNWRK